MADHASLLGTPDCTSHAVFVVCHAHMAGPINSGTGWGVQACFQARAPCLHRHPNATHQILSTPRSLTLHSRVMLEKPAASLSLLYCQRHPSPQPPLAQLSPRNWQSCPSCLQRSAPSGRHMRPHHQCCGKQDTRQCNNGRPHKSTRLVVVGHSTASTAACFHDMKPCCAR